MQTFFSNVILSKLKLSIYFPNEHFDSVLVGFSAAVCDKALFKRDLGREGFISAYRTVYWWGKLGKEHKHDGNLEQRQTIAAHWLAPRLKFNSLSYTV